MERGKTGESPPIILRDVSKQYPSPGRSRGKGQWAVKDVTLEIERGKIFGFLGPNGAGKTTTIKMMMGLTRPTRGAISLLGMPHTAAKVRQRIGFLPENPRFPGTLTAKEILVWTGEMMGLPRASISKKVEETLKEVLLDTAGRKKVGSFSKGMIQRLGIAQAMITSPEILILDEPLSGLDPPGRQMVSEILRRERERGSTIFFSSHILSDVKALCDEVGLIVNGHLRARGTLEEVFQLEGGEPPASLDKRFAEIVANDA